MKEIDYYGKDDNYIHLKFGDCVKMANFTEDFREKYPDFVKAYDNYWMGNHKDFRNAFEVISYIYNNNIPVHLYYNFTDTPVKDREEVMAYLLRENNKKELY